MRKVVLLKFAMILVLMDLVLGCGPGNMDAKNLGTDSNIGTGSFSTSSSVSLAPMSTTGGVYWGAWIDGIPNASGTSFQSRDQFDQMAGKKMSIVGFNSWWYPDETFGDFNHLFINKAIPVNNWANIVNDRGSIPMILWNPYNPLRAPACDSAEFINYVRKYSPRRIAAGDFDAYLTRWAQQIKAWGRPLHIRTMHELNYSRNYANPCAGHFTSWEAELVLGGQTINQRADVIAAWRHIVTLFRNVGATNVKWVWSTLSYASPAYGEGNPISLASIYPGDAYVDWIGVECYNFNPNDWMSCADRMRGIYNESAALGSRTVPILNVEMGAIEDPRKSAWIYDALSPNSPNAIFKLFPRLNGIMYWNDSRYGYAGGGGLWVKSSQASIDQFRAAVTAPIYIAAATPSLPTPTPVPVPTPTPVPSSCTLDGQTVASGSSFNFFSARNSPNCSNIDQVRTCSNGVLSGTTMYAYRSCSLTVDSVDSTTAARAIVIRNFLNVMGRTQAEVDADPVGIAYWTNRVVAGMTETQLAAQFRVSDEYFVRNAYLTELRRRADASGLKYYLSELASGRKTRTQVTAILRQACLSHTAGECL